MTYKEFKEELLYDLEKDYPDAEIEIREVLKNNDQKLDCLTIREGMGNVAPSIYLAYYYEEMERGKSFRQVYDEIREIYQRNKVEETLDLSFISDYETVKSSIVFDLVSYDKNQKLLRDVPYTVYLDLAIVFRVLLGMDDKERTSILIHRNHMEMWGVTEEELMEEAIRNTPRLLPAEISSMNDVLKNILADESAADDYPMLPMYVLTNQTHMNGAGCILYKDLLKEFADELEADLFVLPSSIHEVLLVPTSVDASKQALSEMVRDVNDHEVAEGEILSGHAYYYSRMENALSA